MANQPGVPTTEHEQGQAVQPMSEIPSYPGAEQYQPQDAAVYSPVVYEQVPQPQSSENLKKNTEQINLYNTPEQHNIPQSSTPELQTPIVPETTRSGEKIFVNPELGQSTFKGGVTSTQMVSKVSGYYTVQQGLISDPKSGLLQQTATTGDPTNGTTWQASILFKILQAFWNLFGVN